jgi:hypothetical protein
MFPAKHALPHNIPGGEVGGLARVGGGELGVGGEDVRLGGDEALVFRLIAVGRQHDNFYYPITHC